MRRLTLSPRGGSPNRPCEFLQTVVLPLRREFTLHFKRNQAGAWRRSKSRVRLRGSAVLAEAERPAL